MIRTIFCKSSLMEQSMQTCGYVNRGMRRELKSLKEMSVRLQLPFIAINQHSIDYETDAFILLMGLKEDKFTGLKGHSKFDYSVIVNGKVIRRFEPEETIEECYSFPLLQAKATRFRRIELYYGDEQMDVFNKGLEGPSAKFAQMAIDTIKGLVLINPFRHNGTLRVREGYERLFEHVQPFLGEFNEMSRQLVAQLSQEDEDVEYLRKLKFATVINSTVPTLSEWEPYAELKARLFQDFREIKVKKPSEVLALIDDVNSERRKAYVNILSALDIE